MSEDLQGGGGLGSVKNITYNQMYIENVDWAIEVTQCYGQKNQIYRATSQSQTSTSRTSAERHPASATPTSAQSFAPARM
jgi:hypothetical protein